MHKQAYLFTLQHLFKMRVAIYSKSFDKEIKSILAEVVKVLKEKKISYLLHESLQQKTKSKAETFRSLSDIKGECNFLFSIGGDGTLLNAVSLIKDSQIPILGINTGRLGFLSSISTSEIKKTVSCLLSGKYKIDERTQLEAKIGESKSSKSYYALNEFTIQKRDSSSMITIHTSIDNQPLNSYWADGLIVATPTGATAYSLSCGGPICMPDSSNFIITPIAPHNLTVRPIIIPDDKTLKLSIEGRHENYLISADSKSKVIDGSQNIYLKKAPFKTKIIRLETYNYFENLRAKLNWGLDKRN